MWQSEDRQFRSAAFKFTASLWCRFRCLDRLNTGLAA